MPYKLWAFIELAPFARAREAYGMDDAEFSELQAALLGDQLREVYEHGEDDD